MKNVYDAVQQFYEQDEAWEDILRYEWVTGFLRHKAWQHTDDEKLQELWQHLVMFGLYLAYSEIPMHEMQLGDYSDMVSWLDRNVGEFHLELPVVRNYFQTILDFQKYMVGKKIIKHSHYMAEAAKYITGGKTLKLMDGHLHDMQMPCYCHGFATPDAPAPIYLKLDEHLQQIIILLNQFYQKAEFIVDFERAIFLYHGIMGWDETVLDGQREDFWLGFWDYFLFDYRLIKNDKTPLRNFYDIGGYPAGMHNILKELTGARFAVFFIKKILDEDWLECEDLLTGQMFCLPNTGESMHVLKELLFMGHVFSHNMVLINYVMSMPVSLNLRKRIKEEVLKQLDFYRVQEPDADWFAFFRRHAIAVRHTIYIFTTFSKLNAVAEVEIPPLPGKKSGVIEISVIEELLKATKNKGFSFNDQQLIVRMWLDYCAASPVAVRKPQNWAAGLVANFILINSAFIIDYGEIADMFNIYAGTVREYANKINKILDLREYDLRYMSEEGFILLLMKE